MVSKSAESSLASDLSERFEGQVFVAPENLPDYLAVRETPQHPRARAVREFLTGITGRAPLDWTPIARGVPLPWLRAQSLTKDGETLCVALPNLLRGEGARALEELTVHIRTERAIRWLHPHDGHAGKQATVRAGDAVVFVLED